METILFEEEMKTLSLSEFAEYFLNGKLPDYYKEILECLDRSDFKHCTISFGRRCGKNFFYNLLEEYMRRKK